MEKTAKAGELVLQYRQLLWYISKLIEAYFQQDLEIFKKLIERVNEYCEKLNYGYKYSYATRDTLISQFEIKVSKGAFTLIDAKYSDRPSYLKKVIEKFSIEQAKLHKLKPPKKVVEFTYSGGRAEIIQMTNPEIVDKKEIFNVNTKKLNPSKIKVKPNKRVKVVDGKITEVED